MIRQRPLRPTGAIEYVCSSSRRTTTGQASSTLGKCEWRNGTSNSNAEYRQAAKRLAYVDTFAGLWCLPEDHFLGDLSA